MTKRRSDIRRKLELPAEEPIDVLPQLLKDDSLQTPPEEEPGEEQSQVEEVTEEAPPPKKKRSREWDSKRTKLTTDLPKKVIKAVHEVADQIRQEYPDVTLNEVTRLLLESGIKQFHAGNISINPKPTKYKIFDD